MIENQVDCIVRLHNPKRLLELGRCVFSLVGQTHRPLNIILAVQRFSESDIESVREALRPILSLPNAPTLNFINWQQPEPADARTELLNLGLSVCSGQYVGFLDYDDVLYPEAYELLVGQLQATKAAIVFASTRVMSVDVHNGFVYARSQINPPFHGENLRDLFKANFCPIHSYLIDRSKVGRNELSFDTTLTWEEDYDMLLRVCSAHSSDFGLLDKVIGDYYYKTDGSNTIPHSTPPSAQRLAEYERVTAMIEVRRRTTLVAPDVQRLLGLGQPDPQLTIRGALSRTEVR
ncbi:glycosyltransferase family 2 protein [Paraburkholderia bannensis]|uniref:glycosyltransferase family 2 protein n=1 Tax=Paraburkholderia bannensis TaxID=765414 RepID=UPI002AB0FDE8|nr:glycosyltransferase family 2 protein [Paraburkholderia bannensis]